MPGGTFGDVWEAGSSSRFSGWRSRRSAARDTGALLAAEEEARMQGCQGALLSTFSFLARPFHERDGYEVFGGLPDHPAGYALFFMEER